MHKLDRPRLSVDFNEMLEPDLFLLARDDEKVDSSGAVVSLSEGMRVYVYEPEGDDENGVPRYLLATGIVEKNTATYSWAAEVRWCCRIDRWESEPE